MKRYNEKYDKAFEDEFKNVRAVIFDMDGVICDTESMSLRYWRDTYKKYGIDMEDEVYLNLMGRTGPAMLKGMSEYLDKNHAHLNLDAEEIFNRKTTAMTTYLDENPIPLKEGIVELLDYLDEKGIKRAVATSTRRLRAVKRLQVVGLYERFDHVVCGDDIERSKPDPQIFLTAARALGEEPENCMVLEDSPTGMEASHKGGFITVNVLDIRKPSKEDIERCELIVNDLNELIDYI